MSKTFTLHCFGDSLTEGYTYLPSGRLTFTPYTSFLKTHLDEANNQKHKIGEIKNYGVSGELTEQIKYRFDQMKNRDQILAERDTDEIFVFLGGTNDLGTGFDVEAAFANMYAMIFDCVNNGNKVVVCSIPSTQTVTRGSKDVLGKRRLEYNEKLQTLCKELGTEVVQFFDLYRASGVVVTEEEGEEKEGSEYIKMNAELAADMLHFNVDGYKLLAEGVANCLEKFLN